MARKKHKYHYLYKTTNLINGKFYVGVHSTSDLNDGYLGSGLVLRRSIRKYGEENFKIEFLEFFEDKEKLFEKEKEVVNMDLIKNPLCMNLKQGGIGGWSIEQQSKNGKRANAKMKLLRETNSTWVEKVSQNMSNGQNEAYKNGRVPTPFDWTGRTHKEETKNKMSKKAQERIGDKNSQFGTCWIHNDKESKKIKKTELKKYLKENWIKGRKIKFTCGL